MAKMIKFSSDKNATYSAQETTFFAIVTDQFSSLKSFQEYQRIFQAIAKYQNMVEHISMVGDGQPTLTKCMATIADS